MKYLKFAVPAIVALVIVGVVAQGLLHRADYAVSAGQEIDPPTAFTDGRPNLVAATFYSAWCSSCAVLDPKLRKIAPEFEGRAIEFTKFDFSMGQPESLTLKAEELGVERVYLANKGATGFMALIDRRSQEVVSTIYMSHSDDQIRAELNQAIATASAPHDERPSAVS